MDDRKKVNDNLVQMVKRRFNVAESANLRMHVRCRQCTRQMEGDLFESDVEDDDLLESVTMNITSPLVIGFLSMLEEILDPLGAQPFTLAPSPLVELPEDVERDIQITLENNLPTLLAMVGGDISSIQNLRNALRETTQSIRDTKASKAADTLTKVLKDKLLEAGFSDVLSDFLYNFLVYPLAVVKGPIYVQQYKKQWNAYGMSYAKGLVQKVEIVTPFNLLPSPHARDLQTCPFVIERQRYHSNDILDLVEVSNFDADAIIDALDDYDRHIIPYLCDTTMSDRQPDEDETLEEDPETLGYYDILVHYGQVQGKYLVEYGVEVDDPRRMYEAEIWVLGDYIIRASLTPPGRQPRPFFSAAYLKSPGKLWGRSAVEVVRDTQIQCTEAVRALARNMRFSSGPIGEVVADQVMGEDDPEVIFPLMVKAVKANNASNLPTYRFTTVPSNAEVLLAVYKAFSTEAYNLLGIPPIAYGNTQGVATLGRTSGGIAMVMNQASKPVKRSMGILEKDVIRGVIAAFLDYEMMLNPDPDIRGDVQVQVNGVRSLSEKETKEGKIEWLVQSLTSAVGAGLVPKDVWLRLLRTIFEDNGIDTHGLPSFALQDALTDDIQSQNPSQGLDPASGANPTANLDGRSQGAINQINESNGGG